MFMTAMAANPLIVELTRKTINVELSWGGWALAALLPGLLSLLVMPAVIYWLARPEITETPEATALAREESLDIVFEQRDIFDLARDYRGFFDGVWEYTCFCAIDPARRPEYVRLVREILKPGAWLLACFYPLRDGTDGPPFPTSEAEVRTLLAPHFIFLESYLPAESVERRQGFEWMVMARARDSSAGATS